MADGEGTPGTPEPGGFLAQNPPAPWILAWILGSESAGTRLRIRLAQEIRQCPPIVKLGLGLGLGLDENLAMSSLW